MRRAYTVISQNGPHLDVGPTLESEESAQTYIENSDYRGSQDDIWQVTSWVDDFTDCRCAYFLFRTDGIHEVSFVVSPDTTDEIEHGNEAAVRTTLIAESEVDKYT